MSKMRKRSLLSIISIATALTLTACGSEPTAIQGESATAKPPASQQAVAATATATASPAATAKPAESPKQDIWTYYNDAKWADDFKGLKTSIEKVVVSDKAPKLDNPNDFTASAVGIKLKLENTTDGVFTTYPDQARLVTSTGEQIDSPAMFVSDHLGGEIEKGVIKEGNIIWYLKRGNAADIQWIKLKWNARVGAENKFDTETKEYEVEIKLK